MHLVVIVQTDFGVVCKILGRVGWDVPGISMRALTFPIQTPGEARPLFQS